MFKLSIFDKTYKGAMLPFRFKVKGYLNETGEYSELYPAESATIIHLILQHWFNESLPNNLDIVVIQNDKGDQLVIDHVKRDIFDYYLFVRNSDREYFHKKTDIQFMFFVLESFFSDRLEDLKLNLTRTTDDWSFLRGEYLGKSFDYAITRAAIWRNLNVVGFQFIFLLTLILSSIFLSTYLLVFAGIYLFIAVFTSLRQVRMFREYYRDNKNLRVRLSRANGDIEVSNQLGSRVISKSEINKVTKYIHNPDDVGSMAEYYTEVEFHNGNVLNLTCLLIPQAHIESKFANHDIALDVEFTQTGKLKRKTKLDRYFVAAKAGQYPQAIGQ
jgi:hypothetical protein